jgi:lipopolysaccharide transport system ATP-binding protein
MAFAVRVHQLGKRYRVGRAETYDTLAARLGAAVTAPVRNYRRLRQLVRFADSDEADVIWALRDVSFQLAEGEVLGVVGRNGAGKTTLLKILSRTVDPTRGSAELHGRTASLLEVGTGFHPELTGRENVFLNGSILGMRRDEIRRRFDEIVEFAGVARFIETPVKRYSTGMQLRLAFSVAAHLDADVLMADEVLAVGDAEFQRKCVGKMHDVATSGRTVIFVSHNKAAVASLCTRAIWLELGRLRADGPVDEVLSAYIASIRTPTDGGIQGRPDREGDGRARITNIEFVDAHGETVMNVLAGENVTVRVSFERSSNEPLRRPYATVYLHAATGEPVAMVSSLYTGEAWEELPRRGSFLCRLPRLPLNTGEYVVSAAILADGRKADFLRDAAVLAVEALSFYGTGRHPEPTAASVLLENSWELVADE